MLVQKPYISKAEFLFIRSEIAYFWTFIIAESRDDIALLT